MIKTLATATALCGTAFATWVQDQALTVTDKDSQSLELTFGVRHPEDRVRFLEQELLSRSSPSSPMYGQWLSNEAVQDILQPHQEDVAAIQQHLKAHGVTDLSYSPNKDWISAKVSVATAERILGVEYVSWTHPKYKGGPVTRIHPRSSVTLPDRVAKAVAIVEPTRRMPPIKTEWLDHSGEVDADILTNSPATLRELYNVTGVGSGEAVNPTGHAVTAFIKQYYNEKDFDKFWNNLGGKATGVPLPDVHLVGDATTGRGGVEAMLDIEYINAMAAGIRTAFWGFGGVAPDNAQNEPFLKWLVQMNDTPDSEVPKIFSTSYGEDESSTTMEEAERMNAEFVKAGSRGISILFASGDEGANCKGGAYVPEWPSSSPWVTAVGGTTRTGNSPNEKAAGLSSGGFSARWAMPSYMESAVQGYVSQGFDIDSFPPRELYNISGRAYPDVSAQATGYTVYAGGIPNPGVAGTSCAAPTFSGVIAMLVDRRLKSGKSSLGFLNPLIYDQSNGVAGAMNDITTGNSNGCFYGKGSAGWPALRGWDAVTGMGTPDFGRMLDKVLALP